MLVYQEQEPTESRGSKKKPSNINEKQIFNIKSVQTACSTIDIKTTKCKYCEIRSKSQEELTKITKTQEVIKRKDIGKVDVQNEVTEWFEIHSDKVKVKLWGDKMQKLAEKLKKPGGEEKLRTKIEKYLKKVPDQFSDGDDEKMEFRKQLPDDIIRKIKSMYLKPTDACNEKVNIYRMELHKYCSRFKMDNFKKVIFNWLKNLNIKKKDFLGRNVKKDDVFKYVTDKLEPLVLDRPKSDLEYKNVLKSYIADIMDNLPLVLGSTNKEFYVNSVTETLVNDIFNIESKVPSNYIQPTIREIKEFVRDEITFFLERSHVAISTKRMECVETELIDILLDLTDIVDMDNYVVDDVTTVLKDIGKVPDYKAKYFANILLRDYKEFFFRPSFFQQKDKADFGHPDVYSVFQNTTDIVDINEGTNFDVYMQQLIQEIYNWVTKLNIPNQDKYFTQVAVKELASDVVDRHKYLALNTNTIRTDAEELEHLKYLIFKWTRKLVGQENTAVLVHTQELIERINNIPKPAVSCCNDNATTSPPTAHIGTGTKTFNEKLIDEISDWFHDIPIDLYVSKETSINKELIKDLAEDVEKGLNEKDVTVIDERITKWTKKVFNNKLNSDDVELLKNKIKSIPFTEENLWKEHRQDKVVIRSYEDIVDEWLDTVPIDHKMEGVFRNHRYKFVHELAVNIFNITRLNQSHDQEIENKLQENISNCMKKLPLDQQVDTQNHRDKYAAKLVKNIQAFEINYSKEIRPKQTSEELIEGQFEGAILDWLKELPLYRSKSLTDKEKQMSIIKQLSTKINGAISEGYSDLDDDIIDYVKMLDPKQNDDFIQDRALQLKLYLQKLKMFGDVSQEGDAKDKYLVANIETWINDLPVDVNDENHFEDQKKDFIDSMKRLRSSGSDNGVLKKEILTFLNTLPLDRGKRGDEQYLDEKASKLIHNLTSVPTEDESIKPPVQSNEIVRNAIKDWTGTLPLTAVYCPRELNTFIDDMSIVITSLLIRPEYTTTEENDRIIHREIVKFLRRFPLQEEQSTETDILRMAEDLTESLKYTNLYERNDKKEVDSKNIIVYGVSLNTTTTGGDFSIQSIQEDDINANLDRYTKQLINQIVIWLHNLNVPNMHEEGFKEVVINDLAGDIIDRHKYLELNPQSGGSREEELEHLKYQIFKWINKLVGENNLETINHAEDLMQRIQRIPVPMLVRPQDKRYTSSSLRNQQSYQFDNSAMPPITQQEVNDLPMYGEPTGGGSLRGPLDEQQNQAIFNRMSSSAALGIPNKKCCTREPPPPLPTPQEGSKEAIYEKYQKIFREKCDALPIDTSTPENAKLAELAKTGIYNGIVKTFFKLKSDPVIENDYGYFEFMLEEKIEEMLDILPQTEELISKRHAWKLEVLARAIDMLDELHTLTDRPSFRQRVRNKFNRNFAKDLELEECFLLQQGFLAEMADAYILETKYKEEDPVKAKIYKHRLMKRVDELANHLAKEHNAGFRFFKKAQLVRIAMKVLEQVPIPDDNVLKQEAEEIQLADEIEQWYKELPTTPLVNPTDGVLRKRMMDILAKKLYDIEKQVKDEDPSKEAQMKHEMSQFLEKRAKLQPDQDLNINFMVDQLNNRIKNNWLKEPVDYKEFEQERHLSSTFAQVDNNEFLEPLMDAATSTTPLQSQVYPGSQASLRKQQSRSSCCPPKSSQGYVSQSGHQAHSTSQVQSPARANVYGVYADTSQMGPSQNYISHSIRDSGQARSQASPGPCANCSAKSQHGPSEGYISHQGVPMQSMGPNQSPPRPSPYGPGLGPSQFGPSEGYVSHQSPRTQSMGQNVASPRSTQGSHVETSQYRQDERYMSQQGAPMQNLAASPPRCTHAPQTSPIGVKSSYDTQQGQPMSNTCSGQAPQHRSSYGSNMHPSQVGAGQGHSSQGSPANKTLRGALRNSQHMSDPTQNMNQSRPQDLTSQPGLTAQEIYGQNMPVPTVYGPQGQAEFGSRYQVPGSSPADIPGILRNQGRTPSHAARSPGQVPGADEMQDEEMDYLMRCNCLAAYRKRRRYFACDERCTMVRPYRCYF